MKTNIALIGFMGTGKTTVGRILARGLNKEFIELDGIIEKNAGKSIPEIFHDDGEIRFRELEIDAVSEVAKKKNTVIACGGGVVLNSINIDRLKKESVIICLAASPSVILRRTSDDEFGRPLLNVADRTQQIKSLLKIRRPFYRQAADIMVNTSGLSINGVKDKILELLKNHESINR